MRRASSSCSAIRAARSCRCTTRSPARASSTSWYATSRARRLPPTHMHASPARPACVWRLPGPGATNLVTGIANAMMDSVPMVCITGNVASPLMGTDAFQEIDILGVTLPIVKHSWIARDPNDVPAIIAEAFHVATSGRPGPVLIDLPKDVQVGFAHASRAYAPPHPMPRRIDPAQLRRAEAMIGMAERPLLYIGGGVRIADAVNEVRAFARATGIPAVSTLQGLGALPSDWPGNLGMLGMHGSRAANDAVQACDLLIVLGARFDDRATGKLPEFAPYARVIHIDIDAAEIGKLRDAHVAITADVTSALTTLTPRVPSIAPWIERCERDSKHHAPALRRSRRRSLCTGIAERALRASR